VREGGKACFAAETLLRADPKWKHKTIILRLAGIYGPGRLPHVVKIRNREPLPVASEGFLNLIHVDDIVQIIRKTEATLIPPQLLCVSDGRPVQRKDFYQFLADRLGCPPPKFTVPEPGSTQEDRARGSKKIRSDRLVQTLHPEWIYPSYQEGVDAIVRHAGGS
jgi:nucleoside-diphosphate-sugar epimerase